MRKPEIVEAILLELNNRSKYIQSPVRTIYFGGGTPSVLEIADVERIINEIKRLWECQLDEVTFEANPDDISVEYVEALKSLGVNRISLGIQSFVDDHLRLFNRRHTANQAITAVETIRKAGIENVSIDLIYGMPFLSPQQWKYNIEQAINLDVEHISAYHLTIEKMTAFGKQAMLPVDDKTSQLHYDILCEKLCEAGFEHYEISNFAKTGRRSIHNWAYWRGISYLGVGPSAHSFDGVNRYANVASNAAYLRGVEGQLDVLSECDRYNEKIMVALRTADGFANPDDELLTRARKFIETSALIYVDNRLQIPEKSWLISDYIISELFA